MTLLHPEIQIVLRLGDLERVVPVAALAAITHQRPAPFREALSRLFFALSDRRAMEPHQSWPGEPTEGENVSERNVQNVPRQIERNVDVHVHARAPSAGDARRRGIHVTAEELATQLDDPGSLPFYRRLVADEAPELLRAALRETCARREEVRGRLGAYFTGVLRALRRTRSLHPTPYARTPPDTP